MKTLFLLLVTFTLPCLLFSQNGSKPDSTVTSTYKPGDHELLLMPTAYTMEKGQSYFEDYELIFINFSYAATNSTHISLFSMFPITTDFLETLAFGAKQNLYQEEKLAVALFGSYVFEPGFAIAGAVVSAGPRSSSFHFGFGYGSADGGGGGLFMLGYRGDFSRRFSFLAEYSNSTEGVSDEASGVLTLGIRFRGETMAWDLGGIRPLDIPAGSDLLMIPLLKASVVF